MTEFQKYSIFSGLQNLPIPHKTWLMSFQNALSTFNADHSGIGSRGFRDDNEHGHTYHKSHKENVAPQLSILSTYLRDSSLPKASLQVHHALDFAIGFFGDPQSFPLPPTTDFNHPVPFDTSLLPIWASATAPGHQLLPSPTDPTSINYNIQINCQTTLNILYHHCYGSTWWELRSVNSDLRW